MKDVLYARTGALQLLFIARRTASMSTAGSISTSPCACLAFSLVPPPISRGIPPYKLDKGDVCAGCSSNSLQIMRCDRLSHSTRLVPRANPLLNLQIFPPYGHGSPGFTTGKTAIVLFQTNDLRLHDHPALIRALETHDTVIPMFIFPQSRIDTGNGNGNYNSVQLGDTKTGQYSTSFLLDSVRQLKKSLQNYGSDLLVKKSADKDGDGKTLVQTARALRVSTVFFHTPPNYNDRSSKSKYSLERRLEEGGIEAQIVWAGTLHSLSDLTHLKSSERKGTFHNFVGFREYVHRNCIKHQQPLDAPASMPVFPAAAYHHSQQLPKCSSSSSSSKYRRRVSRVPGGESVALERLSKFLAVTASLCSSKQEESLADFSVRIIPWLSSGNLSPRRLYAEMKRCSHLSKATLRDTYQELIWRDYFRFLPHFSSSMQPKQQPSSARI